VAIASSSPAVAARCAHARAGVGAATTQNVTDPRLGPRLLDELSGGATAEQAVTTVSAAASFPDHRQLTCVDARGRAAAWSGALALGRHGHATREDAAAAGNLLATEDVVPAMLDAFAAAADRELPDRLLLALEQGLAAGGEAGPVHSAGLLVVEDVPWATTDLRVDWHDDPVAELRRVWQLWHPQVHDYVTRALDPTVAPSYGVPGDA
jgi:uncharacterized Ntn-hydrolase superfamily protein